jgi:hypothetical protein
VIDTLPVTGATKYQEGIQNEKEHFNHDERKDHLDESTTTPKNTGLICHPKRPLPECCYSPLSRKACYIVVSLESK